MVAFIIETSNQTSYSLNSLSCDSACRGVGVWRTGAFHGPWMVVGGNDSSQISDLGSYERLRLWLD